MLSKLMHRILISLLVIFSADLIAVNPASTQYVQQSIAGGQTYTIGEYAQGGVIFWLTPNLQHGLVASIVDMNSGALLEWSLGGADDNIGATANALSFGENYTTTGKINSALIVNKYGEVNTYAAGACALYSVTVNGVTYDDWYLPSLAEIGVMMSMQSVINNVSVANGGTAPIANAYWTSFEYGPAAAWCQNFSSAVQTSNTKSTPLHVRAVRAF